MPAVYTPVLRTMMSAMYDDVSNVYTSAEDDDAGSVYTSAENDDGGSPEEWEIEESSSGDESSQDITYVPPWLHCMSEPAPEAPSILFATTSDILKFVNQINSASLCSTNQCKGKLVESIWLQGKGGSAKLEFKCSGCNKRKATFNSSSSSNAHGIPDLSLALRVASIAAGCRFATYNKLFHHYLGANTVTEDH